MSPLLPTHKYPLPSSITHPYVLALHPDLRTYFLLKSIFSLYIAQALSHAPDSSVHGILQARILEWVAVPFSRESAQPWDQTHISCIFCIGR